MQACTYFCTSLICLFAAINSVESPDGIHVPYPASHIGNYQISHDYWQDTGLEGQWKDVLEDRYARQVMLAYWRRYVPEALENLDFEVLARTHNGGPNGQYKTSTQIYWLLVKENMMLRSEECLQD